MKESVIEAKMGRMVRGHGGLFYKFVSPGNPGVPDRIVVTPHGEVYFVELKTDTGRLAALQKWHRQELEKCGANVRVLYGLDEVQAFVREVFGA